MVSDKPGTVQLQNIENALGFPILDRESKNIDFTEAGQILLATAKNIHNQLSSTITYLEKNIKNNELNTKFAVSHSLITQFFPRFIHELSEDLSDLKLEIIAANLKQGMRLLTDGSCDFLICYCDQKTLAQMDFSLFLFHKIVKVEILPVTALYNNQPKYSFNELFPLLSYSKQAYLRKCADDIIENQLNYRILYETDNASDLKELVLQGLGIAWLPKLLVEKEIAENKLKIVEPINFHTYQDVYIIRRKIVLSKRINYIWDFLTSQEFK